MARVNLFDFTRSVSNESVSTPDVKNVSVDTSKELPPQLKDDTDKVEVDKDVSAEVSNTKTTEPGPKDGGGDGTADFTVADKATTNMKVGDVARSLDTDQQGGHELEELPNKVKPKDNLSAKDISTSVEAHDGKSESDSEATELKSIDASGAEVLETPDQLIVDLDSEEFEPTGLTDAADKGVSEADAVIAKTNELNKAVASVERYIGLLNRLDETGRELTPELRKSISWALESIDAELFFEERAALESFDPSSRVSLEANELTASNGGRSGTINDGEDPGVVSKGLSAKLKKILEAAVRMFWRAVNAVQDAYNALTSNMPKLREHLAELRSKVKVLDGGTEFTMKGAQRLLVGDEFVGDSRQALNAVGVVANELLISWPAQLGKVVKEWTDGRVHPLLQSEKRNNYSNEAKLIDQASDVMKRAFRSMKAIDPSEKSKVPSGFLNAGRVNWSGPLPGNRALYTGVNDVDLSEVGSFSKAITINFSAMPGEDTHSDGITIETLSAGEALIIIRELEKLTHGVDDAKKGMVEIKKVFDNAFGTDGTRFMNVAAGAMQREDLYRGGELALSIAKATYDSQNQFYGYISSLIKAYMGYISASIKAEAGNTIDGELAA